MECIGTSRLFLIRTYPVETAHKDIAKLKCIQSVLDEAWSKLKARVFSRPTMLIEITGTSGYPAFRELYG